MGAVFGDPAQAELHTQWRRQMPVPNRMPNEGAEVYNASGRPITLLERIGDIVTGEANVYRTEQNGCIKIFFPEKLTEAKIRKIKVMSRSRNAVCAVDPAVFKRMAWPDTVIYADQEGKLPIGYRMRCFQNQNVKKLKISRRNRPDPLFAAKLACSVSELANFAENAGFRLTDALSLRNMLYDQQTGAVYVIDMDSAEFAHNGLLYETVVGLEFEYAPERLASGCATYHTAQEDAWQLQNILFQILLSAQPYLRKGGSDIKEDTVNGNYAFPRGIYQSSPFELPNENYRNDMMKLPAKLRELFFHSFSGSGECFRAEKRLSAKIWLREMQQYQEILEKQRIREK